MSPRAEVEPTHEDKWGAEAHPAFGMIGASRMSSTGTALFDSDILHRNLVRITVHTATRKRDLHHDWIHSDSRTPIVELLLSEAQWASFVSTMNVGDGVPCTLTIYEGKDQPGVPHDPRLAHSMAENNAAAHEAFDQIQDAMAKYDALPKDAPAKDRRAALEWLRSTIRNSVPNVNFAGKTLTNHAENVVQKARADIEAFVVAKAHQLGMDPNVLSGEGLQALTTGDS